MGAAIEITARTAEKLRFDNPGEFTFHTTTSTVPLIDDYIPNEIVCFDHDERKEFYLFEKISLVD